MGIRLLKRIILVLGCICTILMVNITTYVRADELEEPAEIETHSRYMYVREVGCTLSISSGTATVNSKVKGYGTTTATSVTVYVEKLVGGSWQSYASWTHTGGGFQQNTDTTGVSHGTYRVWMSVYAEAPGFGCESFDFYGNTVVY